MALSSSVVIVTWNAREVLRSCLESVTRQRSDFETLEVIVVDNGSADGTGTMLASDFPDVRVISSEVNLGFAAGANLGMAARTLDTVILLNNDAVAEEGALLELATALQKHPEAAAVTARIMLFDVYAPAQPGAAALVDSAGRRWAKAGGGRELVNSTGGELTRSANGRDRDWLVPADRLKRESGPVLAFSGGAVALRGEALEKAGNFDERYFMYYEDADLSWRLRQDGWTIWYESRAVIRHRHAASSGTETAFFLFHNERNRVLFAIKNMPVAVLANALGRTLFSLSTTALRSLGPDRRAARAATVRKARALGSALRLAPSFFASRRASNQEVSRRELAALLVSDQAD